MGMREFIVEEDFHPDVRGYPELTRCCDCKWWDKRKYECKNDDVLRQIKDCGCGSTFRTEPDFFCADGGKDSET